MCRACMGWASMNDLIQMNNILTNNPESTKRWHTMTIICLITSKYDNGDYFHKSADDTDFSDKQELATYLLDRYLEWKPNNLCEDDVKDDTNLYKGNPTPEYVDRLIDMYKINR